MLHAGELRQRISIQRRSESSDGHDGVTETWATTFSRWPARVTPLTGRDLVNAQQIDPRLSHEVRVRYWAAYPTDLAGGRARLLYHDVADRTFEIVGPPRDVDERHRELRMLCREVV